MVSMVLALIGLGLLLWLLAASTTDGEAELASKFEVAPDGGDQDSPSIGMDLFGLDDSAGLDVDDSWGQSSDDCLPALHEDAGRVEVEGARRKCIWPDCRIRLARGRCSLHQSSNGAGHA